MTLQLCLQTSRPLHLTPRNSCDPFSVPRGTLLPTTRQLCPLQPKRRHCEVHRSAIGFDLGGEKGKGTEKHADTLIKAASSLLLYQNVLSGKPAKAFLKLLLLLQRGRLSDILETYGDFYSSLAIASHLSWQDYLLEQILLGKQNAFAKAAARGELPKSSPRHKAAAYDLDILQKLAVAESTLVSWIEDVASSLPEGWKEAALSSGPSTAPQKDAAKTEELDLPSSLEAPDFIQAPLSPSQRSAYRARIGGKWRWSEALPELQYFYETHGFGVTSTDIGLRWSDGLIDGCDYSRGWTEQQASDIVKNVTAFAKAKLSKEEAPWPPTDIVDKNINVGELVREVGPHGIRVLNLHSTDLTKLADVANALSLYPRVKFAVVCNGLLDQKYTTLSEVFAGNLWPQNAKLYLRGGTIEAARFRLLYGSPEVGDQDNIFDHSQ